MFVQTLVTITRRKAFDIVRLQVYTRGDTECMAIDFGLDQYFMKKCRLLIDDLETDWSREEGHDPEFIQECSDHNHLWKRLSSKASDFGL